MRRTLFTLLFTGIVSVTFSQEPCSPVDPGEWKPVKPVLYLTVYEASEKDLLLYPHDAMYQGELRINGVLDNNSPNGINLEPQQDFIITNPAEIFTFENVDGKSIARLVKPLDRDGPTESLDDDMNVITFTLKCSPISNSSVKIFYDVSVMIKDKNDNPPEFTGAPYEVTIGEMTPIGNTVLTVSAIDKDSNLDGNITYTIVKDIGVLNGGSGLFSIDPLNGDITIKSILDFESLGNGHMYYTIRVLVEDGGPDHKMSAYTDVKINIIDGNDNKPAFMYSGCLQHRLHCILPRYTANFNSIVINNEIRVRGIPDGSGNDVNMIAKDTDGVPSDVTFSIAATRPTGYESYFIVETRKESRYFQAILKQTKTLEYPEELEILLKAEEISPERHFEIAMVKLKGQKSTGSNQQTTTTQASIGTTAPLTNEKRGENSSTQEFSQTTVALIVVVAVTLTIVVCLAVALACMFRRRHLDFEKAPLTPMNGAHDNRAYSEQL